MCVWVWVLGCKARSAKFGRRRSEANEQILRTTDDDVAHDRETGRKGGWGWNWGPLVLYLQAALSLSTKHCEEGGRLLQQYGRIGCLILR